MRVFLLSMLCFVCCIPMNGQLPSDYSSELLTDTYVQPMGTVFNTDGTKMFVWTLDGKVYVSNWNGTSYTKQASIVLDIGEEVGAWRDLGLLSICLDPDFDTNGYIYLYYAVDRHHLLNFGTGSYNAATDEYFNATICRVTRYTLNHNDTPMTTDYSSRLILLGETASTGVPITYESHAGGTLLFGTDGTLLLTTGDGASYTSADAGSVDHTYYVQALADGIIRTEENVGAFRSQMINSHSGKLLRLDPTNGNGVSSNPFYDGGNPRSAASRVYALGLRNPFRASIKANSGSTDPADADPGMLSITDVGWKDWEDLHIIDKPGLNAGWPLFEGQLKHNPTVEPEFESYYDDYGTTQNADEANQTFVSLISQPTSYADDPIVTNRRYTHSRPAVSSYQHASRSQVPAFSGTTPTNPRVNASGSPTTGIESRGNSFTAGPFITGINFGTDMTDKLLYSDYRRDYINVATLNTTNSPWFSDVSEFAPINFGDGIVHLIQNPVDGSVYYTNVVSGTIGRIYYTGAPLSTSDNDRISIEIYPNPTNSKTISIRNVHEEFSIEIYNTIGQKVYANTLNSDLDIHLDFEAGIYNLILNSQNNTSIHKRIVIAN